MSLREQIGSTGQPHPRRERCLARGRDGAMQSEGAKWMIKAWALLGLVCLPLISAGCARDTDPKTYEIPSAAAAEFRTVVCSRHRLASATAVVCPDTNK